MRARVFITPKKGVLDPQGKAVERSLHARGFNEAHDIHIGKYIELALDGVDREQAVRASLAGSAVRSAR